MSKESEFENYINSTINKIESINKIKSVVDENTYKSKRFKAACMAMQGLIMTGKYTENGTYNPAIGRLSFELADELLKAENNENK